MAFALFILVPEYTDLDGNLIPEKLLDLNSNTWELQESSQNSSDTTSDTTIPDSDQTVSDGSAS